MKTIYLAGPMRGIEQYNFPAFLAAEEALAADWRVLNPARHDLEEGFDPSTPFEQVDPAFIRKFQAWDVAAVMEADAIALLPGWSESLGATAEHALARWMGKEILRYDPAARRLMPAAEPEDVLEEALRITGGARMRAYGHPAADFARTAAMWSALKGVPFAAQEVALFMACVKLSRQANRHGRDNLVDLAGYARCAALCAEHEQVGG